MASAWGKSWGAAFGAAFGQPLLQPSVTPQDSIKWGYGPVVKSAKVRAKKTLIQRRNEALLLAVLQ